MWFLFALICLLGWGFADLFYKKGANENDTQSHLKTAVWVGLVMGICAFVMMPFSESNFSLINIVKYSPASLSYIISMVIGYAGLRYLELSIISPVQNSSGALSAIIMSIYFVIVGDINAITDETGFTFISSDMSTIEIINDILIIVGILAIVGGVIGLAVIEKKLADKEIAEKKLKVERKYKLGALALLFPLLYCLFDTIGTAADGIILDEETGLGLGEIDVLILYGLTFLAAGIICWLYMLIKNKRPYNPFSELTKGVAAVFEEFGQIFYVYAMAAKPVLAAPMIASYCIVSVILSKLILKEKLTKSQYAVVFIVILGIVMLGISEGIGEM